MRKDTRFWITVPTSLSLAVSAAMLTPALAQANESESESSWQSESTSEPSASSQQSTQSSSQQASSQQASSQQGSDALSQLAEQESDLSEFVKAVEKAGMAESLTSGTAYTIFAPTNDALESDSNLQDLMASDDPQDQQELVNLLRAHIVADDVDPEMARTIGKAKTVGGGEVELTAEGDKLQVGGNEVVTADIQQGNLRIYSIDGVLEASASPAMASSGSQSSSQTASSQSGSSETGSMASADFDQLDQDGDGYLSEDEMQQQQTLAAEQSQLDQDQDGRVSRTEFAAFEQSQSGMPSSTDPQSSTDPSGSSTQPESEQDWQSDDQR